MTSPIHTNVLPHIVFDANVLFPFTLRDTFLRLADARCIQIRWSQQILEEMSLNLVQKAGVTQRQSEYLLTAMKRSFPDAMVTGYEALIDTMPNDKKDRHVAAVAVKVSAPVIVTNNIKDFRHLPSGVEAQTPDDFLLTLFHDQPHEITEILRAQAADMRRQPVPFEQLLQGLAKTVPAFIEVVYLYINGREAISLCHH